VPLTADRTLAAAGRVRRQCKPGSRPGDAHPVVTPSAGVVTAAPTPTAAYSATSERTYVSGTMVCHITKEEEPTVTGEYQPNPL